MMYSCCVVSGYQLGTKSGHLASKQWILSTVQLSLDATEYFAALT